MASLNPTSGDPREPSHPSDVTNWCGSCRASFGAHARPSRAVAKKNPEKESEFAFQNTVPKIQPDGGFWIFVQPNLHYITPRSPRHPSNCFYPPPEQARMAFSASLLMGLLPVVLPGFWSSAAAWTIAPPLTTRWRSNRCRCDPPRRLVVNKHGRRLHRHGGGGVEPQIFPSTSSSFRDSNSNSATSSTEEENAVNSSTSSSLSTMSLTELLGRSTVCLTVLNAAAATKTQDPDRVIAALTELEQISRQRAKRENTNTKFAADMAAHLDGSWRLVFTTGTAQTQQKLLKGGTLNYFPLKAIQSFDAKSGRIENGIYIFGDFCAIRFSGRYDFDLNKRKVEFDFDTVQLLQLFDVQLQQGQAAQMGAASGLGSESNVVNSSKKKRAFFNWISADATIATARGGGGGLALWKRIVADDGTPKREDADATTSSSSSS